MLYAGGIIKQRLNIVLESYLKLLENVLFRVWMASTIESLSFPSSLSRRIKPEPIKQCTMPSKHGALYPRAVYLPTKAR